MPSGLDWCNSFLFSGRDSSPCLRCSESRQIKGRCSRAFSNRSASAEKSLPFLPVLTAPPTGHGHTLRSQILSTLYARRTLRSSQQQSSPEKMAETMLRLPQRSNSMRFYAFGWGRRPCATSPQLKRLLDCLVSIEHSMGGTKLTMAGQKRRALGKLYKPKWLQTKAGLGDACWLFAINGCQVKHPAWALSPTAQEAVTVVLHLTKSQKSPRCKRFNSIPPKRVPCH
eukprot:jgi/Botrbrau1/13680/Bobra.0378s0011.1